MPGAILILVGLIHILSPATIQTLVKSVYAKSIFTRKEKDLEARSNFIILFGIIWILLGLFLLFVA